MKLSRQDKEQLVDEMAEQIDSSQVVGILDMHSLPAKQLQEIKKELVGDAEIRMSRKTLMELALEQSDKEHIEDLKDNTAIMPAFIFSDSNPFTLYSIIKEKKSAAAASGGEIAPSDVIIPDGDTGLGPGPMIGRIQQLGAPTSVEDGTIHVQQEAVAVEEGETISADAADILSKLDIKPLEVGLDLKLVHEDGEIFDKKVLDVDTDEYRQDIEAASAQAFNLAVNAGYLTATTAETVLIQELRKARNLAVNATVYEEDVIEDILRKAHGQAASLDGQIDLAAHETTDDSDDPDEADADEDASSEDADNADAETEDEE